MKLVVACVPKEYDLARIEKVYPNSAVYVTTKTESEDKVKEQMNKNPFIVYDSDFVSDTITSQLEYARSIPNAVVVNIKESLNG